MQLRRPLARAITLAQDHGVVVLNVIRRGRRLARGRNHQNRQRVVERLSGTDVLVCLSGLENSHIACLMASHADVVREIWGEASRIDDFRIESICRNAVCDLEALRSAHRLHVSCSRAVASLAANGQFRKGCAFKFSVASRHGIWPAAVTGNAARCNRAIESEISELISRRGFPLIVFE